MTRSVLRSASLAVLVATSATAQPMNTVHPYSFFSGELEKTVYGEVLLPPEYPANAPYGVVYILHGSANETQNGVGPAVKEHLLDDLAAHDLVAVLHDSGSGWTDLRREQPRDVRWEVEWPEESEPIIGINRGGVTVDEAGYSVGQQSYEQHILAEVMPFVESHWEVRRDRSGRGVFGHSGGHYGSFILATRNPDVFAFAGGSSGPISWRDEAWEMHGGFAVGLAWGARDPITDEFFYRARDPKELAVNWRNTGVTVMHSAGCVDPITEYGDPACNLEGFARPINDDFNAHAAGTLGFDDLGTEGVFYAYVPQNGPDQRTHNVVDVGIPVYEAEYLPAIAAIVSAPPLPDPVGWGYRASDRDFSIWGWSLHVDRPNRELLTLTDVSRGGFIAEGTGSLTVETPADYAPATIHSITTTGPSGSVGQRVLSDDDGRLRFTVQLGAPRVVDQHSALEAAGLFGFEDYAVTIVEDPDATDTMPPTCPPVWVYPLIRCER